MAKVGELQFGDRVSYDLRASHGGEIESDYVLGFMDYSNLGREYNSDRSIVLLGGPKHHGMPINVSHCRLISRGHEAECMPWRERYQELYPKGKLFPLTQ